MAAAAPRLEKPNVVLVHGAFADGSGWEGVYRILKGAGCTVAVVQNSTASLEDDVAVTKLAIAAQDGPVVLVAHSYGGVVITEAGTDPNVAGLVYVAAFAPDAGESINTLIADPPPDAPVAPLAPQDGFLFLDKEKFPAAFAADVDAEHAAFMADSQVPWGLGAIASGGERAGLEITAELVDHRHRRPHHPARSPALHVQAGGLESRRDRGQSRDLRVQPGGGRRAHPDRHRRAQVRGLRRRRRIGP